MLARHFVFPLTWTIFIGVLCGLSGNSFPSMPFWKFFQFDTAAHAFVFAGYSLLWSIAFSKQYDYPKLRLYARHIAVVSGIFYGILIEILQFTLFIGRSAEWSDMLADSIGCLIGLGVFQFLYGPVLRQWKLKG